jgi:hypothetical protein
MAFAPTDGVFLDITVANPRLGIFQLKQFLKTAGWTCPASGDGSTYFSSSDGITSGASGAGGLDNTNAWFRLTGPDGVREVTFQRTTSSAFRCKTANLPFTGGSPSATQTPSASGEVIRLGSGTDAAPTGASIWTNTGMPHVMRGVADREPPYGAAAWAFFSTTIAFLFEWIPIRGARSTDTDPYLWCFAASVAVQGLNSAGTNITAWERNPISVIAGAVDPVDGNFGAYQELFGDTTTDTIKGWNGLHLSHTNIVGPFFDKVFNEEGQPAKTLIKLGTLMFWWDGSLPSGCTDGGTVRVWTQALVDDLAPEPDATPPTIINVTPDPGELASRTEAVQLDALDLDPGLRAVILTVKFTGREETLVAHDGVNFLPPFDRYSIRSVITNGFRYRLVPNVSWAAAFTLHAYAFDLAGNLEGGLPGEGD